MITHRLIMLLALVATSVACSCRRYHPQEHFCQDDYVLRIKIIGSLKVDRSEEHHFTPGVIRFENIYYPIRITKVYKGNISSLTHLKTLQRRHNRVRYISRLYVPSRISSCSLSMKKSKYYVIMGQIHQGILHHGLCNWRSPWELLTRVQLKGLRKYYTEGCQCSIRTCPTRGWCKKSQLPTECRWVSDHSFSATKCVDKWQLCKYSKKSRSCKWRRQGKRRFKKCLDDFK